MNISCLFPILCWLPVATPGTPATLLSDIEFRSFAIGTNPDDHRPYCQLLLDGTYREKTIIFQTADLKKLPVGLSLTDSTGKTYHPDIILVYLREEKPQAGKNEFSIQISLPEWPSKQAQWIHFDGNIPVTSTRPLSLYPVEMELCAGKSIKVPLIGDEMPQQRDIADLSRLEYLSISAEKGKNEDGNTCTWTFSIGYSEGFLFHGLEFEDMQGLPIPIIKYTPGGLCAGGGGITASQYYTLPNSYNKLLVKVLYLDPLYFETRLIHVDMKVGMGGALPHDRTATKKTSISSPPFTR